MCTSIYTPGGLGERPAVLHLFSHRIAARRQNWATDAAYRNGSYYWCGTKEMMQLLSNLRTCHLSCATIVYNVMINPVQSTNMSSTIHQHDGPLWFHLFGSTVYAANMDYPQA